MNPALFIVFFFWCGSSDPFCEEGRMIHPSCTAAEAWLRAGLRHDQSLLVLDCRPHDPAAAEDD